MERDQAITKLLQTVTTNKLFSVIASKATAQPFNYTLQMVNVFVPASTDPKQNWFTAFAVLCINQRLFAGEIIQETRTAEGKPHLSLMKKAELIDAIASGSKLTKADAG